MAKESKESSRVKLTSPYRQGRLIRRPLVVKPGKQLALSKLPTDHQKRKTKKTVVAPRLRPSIQPGTVLILLAGPYKGKRVVFLKQLTSGALMVTGPYGVNGFPLRRVHQRFVIATSTKLPLEGLDLSKYDDDLLAKDKKEKRRRGTATKESEDVFMSQGAGSSERTMKPERLQAQQEIDASLVKFLSAPGNELLRQYLKTRFTLRGKMFPHLLKF